MKRKTIIFIIILILVVIIIGGFWFINRDNSSNNRETNNISYFTKDSTIGDVINNEAFRGFGNLIFPLDRSYDLDTTLDEIDDILVLDVRERDYFENNGVSSEHAGGGLAAHEEDIMNWLLTK